MSEAVRTRFAPSPTGRLHIGNARTALFNYLYARRAGGEMLLRIEDTDAVRSVASLEREIESDLRWLGLEWPGGAAFQRQSERREVYAEHFRRLEASGRAYPCFCTREELERARREQVAAGRAPRYPGYCANLTKAEADARRARGIRPTLRFRVPEGEVCVFRDLVRGEQRFASDDIGDFVIRREDGSPAFFFCNAVDDAVTGVTDVLRAEDHLANTPRQLMLLAELGLPAPRYGHISLVVDEQGAPLSKRRGAASLADLRAAGYLPGALLNHLARLGHRYGEDDYLTPDELAAGFDLARLGRASARFDTDQLRHWQREALARLDTADLAEWAGAALDGVPGECRQRFLEAVRPNVLLREDVADWAVRVFGAGEPAATAPGGGLEGVRPDLFEAAVEAYERHGPDLKAIRRAVGERTGLEGGALLRPLRLCLTGRSSGPELAELLALMPAERVRARLAGCARRAGAS